MLKMVSFHIQAHLNAYLQILEYFSQSVDVDGLNLLAYSVFAYLRKCHTKYSYSNANKRTKYLLQNYYSDILNVNSTLVFMCKHS